MRNLLIASVAGALAVCATAGLEAAEWGNLTGKFVFDGTAPAPVKLKIDKDPACCTVKHDDESLVVGPDGGIANVVIYVRTAKVPVAPEYEADAKAELKFDNKTCRFEPHILPIRLSQTLDVANSDNCGHNTNVTPLGDQAFNQLLAPNSNLKHQFKRQQNIPIKVVCNIHPWMVGYILPRENPYTAVSGADGSFTLKNLPAQELEFQVWQEKAGFVDTPKWPKGKFKLKIKAGENDLGTVKIPAALFKK
ncbi:MAG: hypothetical protein JNG90_05505 [Planctomycetaceae bacterium]|nr:hypothetical protein [Planctomycetaceae bacterium]